MDMIVVKCVYKIYDFSVFEETTYNKAGEIIDQHRKQFGANMGAGGVIARNLLAMEANKKSHFFDKNGVEVINIDCRSERQKAFDKWRLLEAEASIAIHNSEGFIPTRGYIFQKYPKVAAAKARYDALIA